MISFGALRSPAFRIHTLAPVSFPLTTENHIPPAIAGNGPGCRRDGRVLKPQFLQASCRAQDIALSPGTSREDATLRLSFKPGRLDGHTR